MAHLGSLLDPPAEASQINKLEKGQRELTIPWIKRLAAALGCEPQDLIGDLVPLVGYIGAGAEVFRLNSQDSGNGVKEVLGPPLGGNDLIALRVQGESMYPRYGDGDLIYSRQTGKFIEKECLHKECVIKLRNGAMYLKRLHAGCKPGRYTLRTHNAPDVEDVEVEWAHPVRWHKPA